MNSETTIIVSVSLAALAALGSLIAAIASCVSARLARSAIDAEHRRFKLMNTMRVRVGWYAFPAPRIGLYVSVRNEGHVRLVDLIARITVCKTATKSASFVDLFPTTELGIAERFNDHVLLKLPESDIANLQQILCAASDSTFTITLSVITGERKVHVIDHNTDPLQAELWQRLLQAWALEDEAEFQRLQFEGISVFNRSPSAIDPDASPRDM